MTKREEFIYNSLKLIHQKGFKATTIRDIANVMECDVANVYNYIDSKQGLLESHLFSINEEFHNNVDDILASGYDPKAKLEKLISLYVEITMERPLEASLLVNEWRHLKEPKQTKFINERNKYERKVKKLLQAGMGCGQFRDMDSALATNMFLSSMRWLFQKYTNNKSKINRFDLERELVNYVYNGIGVSV